MHVGFLAKQDYEKYNVFTNMLMSMHNIGLI